MLQCVPYRFDSATHKRQHHEPIIGLKTLGQRGSHEASQANSDNGQNEQGDGDCDDLWTSVIRGLRVIHLLTPKLRKASTKNIYYPCADRRGRDQGRHIYSISSTRPHYMTAATSRRPAIGVSGLLLVLEARCLRVSVIIHLQPRPVPPLHRITAYAGFAEGITITLPATKELAELHRRTDLITEASTWSPLDAVAVIEASKQATRTPLCPDYGW